MKTPDWITDNGREIPLSLMSTEHIINAKNYLIRGLMKRAECSGFTNVEWIKLFNAELTRRSRHERHGG